MIFGIDIDDTITNTSELIIELSRKEYPNYKGPLRVPKEEYDNFKLKYDDYIHEHVTLKADVVETLNYIKSRGHKIYFITYRGADGKPLTITEEYFKKHNIPYDKIIGGVEDKGKVAKENNVSLFIDDKSTIIKQMQDNKIDYLKFYKMHDKNYPYKVVKSWKEILEVLKERNI